MRTELLIAVVVFVAFLVFMFDIVPLFDKIITKFITKNYRHEFQLNGNKVRFSK
jgi:hypothetical protein